MERRGMIIFISGGARSGKSGYAENLALELYAEIKQQKQDNNSYIPGLYYLATSQAMDHEMADRIERHREQRNINQQRGLREKTNASEKTRVSWKTIEEPHNITRVILSCRAGDVVLLDCLTIWLNNVMFGLEQSMELIQKEVESWVSIASDQSVELIIVSNDLNEGMPSPYSMVQEYVKGLEWIHKHLVTEADQAIQVIAGIPFNWKGKEG
jgi:adenosylcobinamide kinase/adenosylcobinamide-phosphate guanylyltransferase